MSSSANPPSPAESLTVAGRTFSAEELQLVRQLLANHPHLSRHELAATVCELLEWTRPNGRLKTRECRDLLERLTSREALSLPEKRPGRPSGPSTPHGGADPPLRAPLTGRLGCIPPVELVLADTPARRHQCREHLEKHHYLGCRTPFGAHLRYLIQTAEPVPETLGVLQYSSPTWRMQARDQWIGWDDATREKNLLRLINQSRFLILPWVHVKNLASHVLALSARRLADDWYYYYKVRPLLVETLVDQQRYLGTCYRAANWIEVGHTSGRGRMDRAHQHHGRAPKRIFLYPLHRNARRLLINTTTCVKTFEYSMDNA